MGRQSRRSITKQGEGGSLSQHINELTPDGFHLELPDSHDGIHKKEDTDGVCMPETGKSDLKLTSKACTKCRTQSSCTELYLEFLQLRTRRGDL